MFTKVEFKKGEAAAVAASEELTYDYLFDFSPTKAKDENFRFMASLRRVTNMPEVIIFPSPPYPNKILCFKGNFSGSQCNRGDVCNNSFALATYDSIPPSATMLLGTTLVMHSRYGFDDRFHTPNIVANIFYPYPDFSFMRPARALVYKRGSQESRMSPWSAFLFKSLLGNHITPFKMRSADKPVCFERAVMTRRYRPVPQERSIVLREVQERAVGYCSSQQGSAASVKAAGEWGLVTRLRPGCTGNLLFYCSCRTVIAL